nr:YbhB/YbcL family Raf kinase inhibitor-like protein [Geomesophilobacter sediminis]
MRRRGANATGCSGTSRRRPRRSGSTSSPFHTEVGINSLKKTGYSGPCPPSGIQRYVFRLYVLDRKLELPPEAGREKLEEAMQTHIIATAELAGSYGRTNEGPV